MSSSSDEIQLFDFDKSTKSSSESDSETETKYDVETQGKDNKKQSPSKVKSQEKQEPKNIKLDLKSKKALINEQYQNFNKVLDEILVDSKIITKQADTFLEKLNGSNVTTENGISLLESKQHLLLSYCIELLFYSAFRTKGNFSSDHDLIDKLIKKRVIIEKIKPIEHKIKYQIDKLIKLALSGTSDLLKSSQKGSESKLKQVQPFSNDQDPLSFKPNLDSLVSKFDQDDDSGLYKTNKIASVEFLDPKDYKKKQKKREKLEKQVKNSEILQELREEFATTPRVISHKKLNRYEQEIENNEERVKEFEEEHMTRISLTKKHRKKMRTLKHKSDDFNKFDRFSTLSVFQKFTEHDIDEKEHESKKKRKEALKEFQENERKRNYSNYGKYSNYGNHQKNRNSKNNHQSLSNLFTEEDINPKRRKKIKKHKRK
ncbi:neuroguidin [Anaeramoeba flamelloides]|uniref:Neuroguidin n=1 Tax=Anaeramoeba flamelloides TaxID=1746091 RepID=A0AAV7Z462_9EUKA|nr:neuroguidin [Anaeramoeba flamelloides]KAJ6238311.1 neuroguidin [Anaeramoeba flamelloides]